MMRQRVCSSGSTVGAQTQFCLEVKALTKEERQTLLKDAGVTSALDATQSLAIKSELAFPWYIQAQNFAHVSMPDYLYKY